MPLALTKPTQRTPSTAQQFTYEDFLERYDGIRSEWVQGEVVIMSPVSNIHQRIGNLLFRILSDFVETGDLGQVFQAEFQMKLPAHRAGREPDIFFIAHEKLAKLKTNYFDGPGDIVVEIISPESIERDRVTKFEEYQEAGVQEYWLIDPLNQQVNFFELNTQGQYHAAYIEVNGTYRSKVLAGLWIKTEWLWQTPSPLMSHIRQELGLS